MSAKKRKVIALICYIIPVAVYLWMFYSYTVLGDGPALLALFILAVPITVFATSLIIHISNAYLKWLHTSLFGIINLGILLGGTPMRYLLYAYIEFLIAILPSVLGAGIGWLIWKDKERDN